MRKLKCAALGLAGVLLVGIVVRGAVYPEDAEDLGSQLALGTEEGYRNADALSPVSAAPMLGMGLLAESKGSLEDVQRFLALAVERDRGYQPRWTLGTFYLRHEDQRAWPLLADALSIALKGGQETDSLFETCWQFKPNAEFLLTHLIKRSADALPRYVAFLMNTQRNSALVPAALELAAGGGIAQKSLLVRVSDRLLASGEVRGAKEIWDLVSTAEPKLELLNNSALGQPQQIGFDWRYNSLPESRIEFDRGVRFDLSGKQPDPLELMFQPVPLQTGKYTLHWESRQSPSEAPSGVFWQATDWRTGAKILAAPLAKLSGWQAGSQDFEITSARPIRLALRVERVPGNVRFAGTVWLRNPRLRAQ